MAGSTSIMAVDFGLQALEGKRVLLAGQGNHLHRERQILIVPEDRVRLVGFIRCHRGEGESCWVGRQQLAVGEAHEENGDVCAG